MIATLLSLGGLALMLAGVLIHEVPAISRWSALKLTRKAVARLPERLRETKQEEWSAELEAMQGSRIALVILAASFVRAARKIAANHGATDGRPRRPKMSPATSLYVDDVIVMFRPGIGRTLPNGHFQLTFTVTHPDGYSFTKRQPIPPGLTSEEICSLLARRFGGETPDYGVGC